MGKLKRFSIVFAVTVLFALSTTSCHREGCPNNFGQVEEQTNIEIC